MPKKKEDQPIANDVAGGEVTAPSPVNVIDKQEEKARREKLDRLKKLLGNSGEFLRLADQEVTVKEVLQSGYAELDRIITPIYYEKNNMGGIPRGVMCEFFGPFAGGKSTLCLMLAAAATQKGHYVFWADGENAFNDVWARQQGVVTERVIKKDDGECGEEYLEALEKAAASGEFALAVVDSITSLQPKDLAKASLMDEARVGAGARMMSRACPRLVRAAKKGNCTIILINQVRQKVGVVYGNPETTPYGEAIKFYVHLRLRISQIGSKKERGVMKDGDEIGIRSNVVVVKNRFGIPNRETVVPIYYDRNVLPHALDQIIDLALEHKIIKTRSKKEGNESIQCFTFDVLKGIAGIDDFKDALTEDKSYIKKMIEDLNTQKVAMSLEILDYVKSLESEL